MKHRMLPLVMLTLTLAACGGGSGGKLPESCVRAMEAYAPLADNPDFSDYPMRIWLQDANGNVKSATEAWNKKVEADYEAIEKMMGGKSAELEIERQAQQCSRWLERLEQYKNQAAPK